RTSLRHHQGQDGSNPFPDEDAATSCLRNGAARAGLQSDTGHEHHGHSAAHGRDEGLANPKKAPQRHPTKTVTLRYFRQSVATQPSPETDVHTPHSPSSVDRPETGDEVLHVLKGVGLKNAHSMDVQPSSAERHFGSPPRAQ